MFEKSLTLSRSRIIRIFVFALLFFVCMNMAVSFAFSSFKDTNRASEILLSSSVCNFSTDDFGDIKEMIAGDKNEKIILLGDSIFYGIGVEDESESVSGYLRKLFPDKSVYNLSSCGSKPLDYYLWINRLKDEDAVFVVQYNYKWFSADSGEWEDRISQKKILSEFANYYDGEVSLTEKAAYSLTKIIPLAANRTKIFAKIFNEKSKEDFVEHLFFGKPEIQNMAYKKRYWKEKDEMQSFNCKISYPSAAWNAETNYNFSMYGETLKFIDENSLEAIVLMPPYNTELIKKCIKNGFDGNLSLFVKTAEERDVKAVSFADKIDEKYFLDDMHLNAEGNEQLAELISKEL